MRALPFLFAIALAAPPARADDKPAPPPATTATAPGRPAPPPASLPIPSPSGKTLAASPGQRVFRAASPGQRVFRIPLGFARVERFYRELLGTDPKITITVERGESGRTLTLISRRTTDTWSQAVARESAVDTTIEVTPIIRVRGPVEINSRAPEPLVHVVIPPSPEVMRQANSIDHMLPPK